jgi:hypothetical protein
MKIPSNVSTEEQMIGGLLVAGKLAKLRTPRLPSRRNVCVKLIAPSLSLMWILVSHADETTSRVNTIRVPAAGYVMKAQLGTDGTIHLLFQTRNGPQYAKSEDSGLTFSVPMPVVDAATQKAGLEFHGEDLAVGKEGRVFVAMEGLYYTSLARGAKAFKPVRNLNLEPSEGFSLAADKGGRVTACFLSGKLFTKVSRDNGETFTANAELNPAWDPCDCCTTSAAYGPDGKLAVLYREETNNDRDMYLVLWDHNRGTKPSRTRVSSTPWKLEGCPMTYYSIRGTDTGYVVAWPTKGQVYFARLDKDGAVLSPGEIKTTGMTGMRKGLEALGAKDGATLVAWKNKDVLGWQLYDAKGQPQGKPGSATSPGTGGGWRRTPERQVHSLSIRVPNP